MTKTSLLAAHSFTWNLYQYFCLLGASVSVIRSQACTLDELIASYPNLTHLFISSGPGHPTTDSGISIPAIHHYAGKIPILGICMGLQCIYSAFGGEVSKVGEIVHGKTSLVSHDAKGLFKALPPHIQCTRYHSLAGRFGTLPSELEVTCWTNSNPQLANDPAPFDDKSSIIMGRKLAANVPPVQIDFYERIRQTSTGKVALMAESKRVSPSKGSFMTPTTPSSPAIAVSYAAAGASVISVLTEPKWFKGTLLDMLEVRLSVENAPNRPAILCKDFIIDPYQIDEARCYGADTILLIVACLSLDQLRLLYNHARSLGMQSL
ncbi:hypothetical protein PTTG_07085 [Puccinia triticina 1-1 BBBD Race 1]|uniref:Indole-3-glycerol-phosphate synthase n=1 Tax=Puccinia triticina (isolate 1-1 / race 1 (BBBD)) TaxID=630390 RepID=A0A180G6W5_PUCT1|nr:hypothetical protein PTTG_07085 [Puccinia triticina 1-1 BBBD Race 1]